MRQSHSSENYRDLSDDRRRSMSLTKNAATMDFRQSIAETDLALDSLSQKEGEREKMSPERSAEGERGADDLSEKEKKNKTKKEEEEHEAEKDDRKEKRKGEEEKEEEKEKEGECDGFQEKEMIDQDLLLLSEDSFFGGVVKSVRDLSKLVWQSGKRLETFQQSVCSALQSASDLVEQIEPTYNNPENTFLSLSCHPSRSPSLGRARIEVPDVISPREGLDPSQIKSDALIPDAEDSVSPPSLPSSSL